MPTPEMDHLITISGLKEEIKKLQAFKDFVHKRFDELGVPPTFPDGPHSKEGCRVGDRIDWIEARLPSRLAPQNRNTLRAICDTLSEMLDHVPGRGEVMLSMEKGSPGKWRDGDLFLRWKVEVPCIDNEYGLSHIIDRYATRDCADGTGLLDQVIASCGRKLQAGIPK